MAGRRRDDEAREYRRHRKWSDLADVLQLACACGRPVGECLRHPWLAASRVQRCRHCGARLEVTPRGLWVQRHRNTLFYRRTLDLSDLVFPPPPEPPEPPRRRRKGPRPQRRGSRGRLA